MQIYMYILHGITWVLAGWDILRMEHISIYTYIYK